MGQPCTKNTTSDSLVKVWCGMEHDTVRALQQDVFVEVIKVVKGTAEIEDVEEVFDKCPGCFIKKGEDEIQRVDMFLEAGILTDKNVSFKICAYPAGSPPAVCHTLDQAKRTYLPEVHLIFDEGKTMLGWKIPTIEIIQDSTEILQHAYADVVVIKGMEKCQKNGMGTYIKTDIVPGELNAGRPIYKSAKGNYLFFVGTKMFWSIGSDHSKDAGVVVSMEGEDVLWPSQASGWRSWDGDSDGWHEEANASAIPVNIDPISCTDTCGHDPDIIYDILSFCGKEGITDIYFFLHKQCLLQFDGQIPVFQHLARDSKLRAFKIDAARAAKGEFRGKLIVTSHRWAAEHHPDEKGDQLKALQVDAKQHVGPDWYWIDWPCMPQVVKAKSGVVETPRTVVEQAYFESAILHMNVLFFAATVLIVNDAKYANRFWCLMEAYFAMRKANASGLVSSLEDPHHRIICMGSYAAAPERKARELELDCDKPYDEMLKILAQDDIEVTNQGDKDAILPKLQEFETFIKNMML